MATTTFLQSVEGSARALFDTIVSGGNVDQVEKDLAPILELGAARHNDKRFLQVDISVMSRAFFSLKELLVTPFQTRTITKTKGSVDVTETMEEMTFAKMFLGIISKENWHNETNKGISHICLFHEESLFCHLIMTAVMTAWNFMMENHEASTQDIAFIAAVAMLHDVGKPASRTFGSFKNTAGGTTNYTKFAGHGLIGGVILQKAYSEGFGFSREQWETLCRVVSVHMCGYHDTDHTCHTTQQKWLRLAMEPENVKRVLSHLSVGDRFGAVRDDSESSKFLESRKTFGEYISQKFWTEPKVLQKLETSGLVIIITGSSGAGKSSLVEKIDRLFQELGISVTSVSRDDVMLSIVSPILGITYEKGSPSAGDVYKQCYEHSHDPANKTLLSEVNAQMKSRISDCIAFGEVCIVDTVAALYPRQFNQMLGDEVLSTEVVQIYVDRNELHTSTDGDRIGITLAQQLGLSGVCSQWNPLERIEQSSLTNLSSLMEGRTLKRDFNNKAQPTICGSYVWDRNGCFGWEWISHILTILSRGVNKGAKKIDTSKLDVVQYVNYIYSLCEPDESLSEDDKRRLRLDALIRRFNTQLFTVSTPMQFRNTPLQYRVFSVKYRDGINRNWRNVWARQCRGVFFFVNDDKTCTPLKYQLQRGAELFTGMLTHAQIASTQDISDAKKLAALDDTQQETCSILLTKKNGGKLDAVLTEKVDGSLQTITFYFGEQASLINAWVKQYGDDLSKTVLEGFACFGLVGVVSTQGTLMIGPDMQDYFVTCALETSGISQDVISSFATTHTPTEALRHFGSRWFAEMSSVVGQLPTLENCGNISLCFEGVCAKRLTAWGKLHQELAVSYNTSMLLLLGVSWSGPTFVLNIPHAMLKIKSIFGEPRYWNVKNADEVDALMTGLEDVVYGRMSHDDFISRFVPSGGTCDQVSPLHAEGFVIYTTIGTFCGLPIVDYNKLKLAAYYMGHKFRIEAIPKLFELSRTASHIFPLSKITGEFFGDLYGKMLVVLKAIHVALTLPESTNTFVGQLEGKARVSYSKATPETRAKMIINARVKDAENLYDMFVYDQMVSQFPSLVTTANSRQDVVSSFRKISMELRPWLDYNSEVPHEFTNVIDDPMQSLGLRGLFSHIMLQNDSVPATPTEQ